MLLLADSRLKNSVRSTIAGVFNRFWGLLFPFIIRTVIIKEIGIEYAGINSLFTSILSVLSISELGFGSAMVYSMYKPIGEKDHKKVCELLNLYRKVFFFVGVFILAAGVALMPFLNVFVKGDCPSNLNIYFAYKSALLTASQRQDVNSNVMTCVNIGMYIIQLILLILFKDYMLYIITMPLATLAINLIRSVIVDKMYPEYKCVGKLDKEELKSIYKDVGALVGHKVNGTIILSADNIVISSFLGLTAVGLYNNYYYVINALLGFFWVYFDAIRPSIGNSIAMETPKKNFVDFKSISIITMWIVGWCSICLTCLLTPFIRVWLGEDYLLRTTTAIILGIYFYVWKMMDVLVVYRDAAGMWRSDFWRPYIVSIVNIVGNIILVNLWGLNGVVFSTLFSYAFISYPWVVKVLFKDYFHDGILEYLKIIGLGTLYVALVGIGTYCLTILIPGTSIMAFIIKGLICLVVPNILFMVNFGRNKAVMSVVKRLLKRKV